MSAFDLGVLFMTLIVDLATIYDHSFEDTIEAFVALCSKYDTSLLSYMPHFFQKMNNDSWFKFQYQANYAAVVEPYELGYSTTNSFLGDLFFHIFDFLRGMDSAKQTVVLTEAWNASIKCSENMKDRLGLLVEKAKTEPVYLIANTNELHMKAILALFAANCPNVPFKKKIDISIKSDKTPVQLAPNIFLCLSYRYNVLKIKKDTEAGLIQHVLKDCSKESVTFVSQFEEDLRAAEKLGIKHIVDEGTFYQGVMPALISL